MNKNMKKMTLFMVILIVAIVVVAAVYLLLLAPGGDSGETPAPSGSASAPVSPSPSESPAVQTETPSPAAALYTREETADGTIYRVTVPGETISYTVTVDEGIFEASDTDGRILFRSKAGGHGYMEISFVGESKAVDLAPNFLDPYLDYKEFEQSGLNYIGGTEIQGETVTVNDGKTQLEAWLVDTDKGVLAVVIGYSLTEKNAQRAELDNMLDTLSIQE